MNVSNKNTLIRLPDVIAMTTISKSAIYALIAEGKFPPPIKLSERTSAWSIGEVYEWIEEKINQRDISVN